MHAGVHGASKPSGYCPCHAQPKGDANSNSSE